MYLSPNPSDLVKRILVMSLLCWGLLIVALTDHTPLNPVTMQAVR
jgi:hypothetical protein